jgi:type IV pilus assembly protein PilA
MNPKNLRLLVCLVVFGLAGCSKKDSTQGAPETRAAPVAEKPTTPLVKASEQSRHFAAVNRQLELGGTVYGFVDVDGDALKFSTSIQSVLQQMAKSEPSMKPIADQDLTEVFKLLGLDDVKAFGFSSVPEGDGFFRNRLFMYMPDGRHGLFSALGGKAAPFARLNLAPADADVYMESEIDLAALYKTIKAVVEKVGGEPASNNMEAAIKRAGQSAAISLMDLIYGLKGHAALVARLDPKANMHLPVPGGLQIPALTFLIAVDGVGPVVEPLLQKGGALKMTTVGSQHVYEAPQPLPLEGLERPVLVVDGGTLFLASSREFLAQCREQKSGLAEDPEFRSALAQVGTEGNGLVYVRPRFFTRVREIETLNPNLPEDVKRPLHFALGNLPTPAKPLVTVRTNLPDGVLVRSHLNRSVKRDIAMITVYNPVTLGLLAAIAVPAFQKVRTESQQKAVINNLRQFSAAGDQYLLETGTDQATYADLVGPDKYIREIRPVAGEDYTQLTYKPGIVLRVRLASGRVVEYNTQ